MTKRKFYWVFQIGGWFLYSLVNIFFYFSAEAFDPRQMASFFLMGSFYMISTHIFRIFIIRWGWLKLYITKLLPRVVMAVVLLSIIHYIFLGVVSTVIGTFDGRVYFGQFFVLINLMSSTIIYFLWSMIYFMYHYVENYNTTLKYDAAINEIKLNRLKAQLNPHFIFNALNSIRALVDENPRKAKTAITQLSHILRNSLVMDNKRLIPLKDEIKTVKDYLELEGVRFEERLQVSFDLQEGSDQFEVPPLMLQTLVENGVKHGISTLMEGGHIHISTKVEDEVLQIQIRNSGQYVNGSQVKHDGYGLENTKERLLLIFGEKASFQIENENDSTVLTSLTVPKHY